MYNIIILMSLFILICITLFLINLMLSMKKLKNREKMTPFECGFDPITNTRLPFSMNFYIMTLLFLIFDMEIILIIPILFNLNNLSMISMITFIIFMFILIISLWMEWMSNYFKWIH